MVKRASGKVQTVKQSVQRARSAQNAPAPSAPRMRFPVALPADQIAITQGFNAPVDYSSLNPNRVQAHEGIDFAPTGSARNLASIPIVAAANGVVTSVRRQAAGYGNYVEMRFDDGRYGALYAHLDDVNVHPGQAVEEGQVIGSMGSTGRSSGRHLHFNLLDLAAAAGNYIYPNVIDPTSWLGGAVASVAQRIAPQPVNRENPRNTIPSGVQPNTTKPQVRYSRPTVVQQEQPFLGAPPPLENPVVVDTARYSAADPPAVTSEMAVDFDDVLVSLMGGARLASGIGAAMSGGLNPTTGQFDLLQAVGLGTGDEREAYLQEKAPLIIGVIVGLLLLSIGVARLVFSPNALK
jgi:hypothetical protein